MIPQIQAAKALLTQAGQANATAENARAAYKELRVVCRLVFEKNVLSEAEISEIDSLDIIREKGLFLKFLAAKAYHELGDQASAQAAVRLILNAQNQRCHWNTSAYYHYGKTFFDEVKEWAADKLGEARKRSRKAPAE